MEYGVYIWLAYGFAAFALVGLTFSSIAAMKKLEGKK